MATNAYTNFCCRSGGSNLNAGTRTGNTTVPGTAADLTYASGSWVNSTRVFTVASGDPVADGLTVGDWCALDTGGSEAAYVARCTARTTTTITLGSTNASAGTNPANGTYTLRVGGAWLGPNAAVGFPFTLVAAQAARNAAGDIPRFNLKNDQTYNITAAITTVNGGVCAWQGFNASYGDFGRATIDGGTTGASYTLLTLIQFSHIADFIFSNNGATGSAAGVAIATARGSSVRCVFTGMRGAGATSGAGSHLSECEAYGNNLSNTANTGGIVGGGFLSRCILHDNVGSNNVGIYVNTSAMLLRCIIESNGLRGAVCAGASVMQTISQCDIYNNGSDGIHLTGTSAVIVENSNLIKNGGYGINCAATAAMILHNCGFGAGTQANTSGQINSPASFLIEELGSVTYPSDVTPWVDPANGDFRINLAQAKAAGRGSFLQTAPSYAGTIGYSDIGAAQHLESGGGGGTRGYAFVG